MTFFRRHAFRLALPWAAAFGVLVAAAALWADDPPGASKAAAAQAATDTSASAEPRLRRKPAADITPAREAAAMTFVNQHHPELSELLGLLQEQSPRDYDRAIRELFRESERLATLRERDEARYELDLHLWKVNSRVQLAAARLSMGDSDSLRRELRELLLEQIDARRAVAAYERDKLAERVQRLDKQIEQMDRQRSAIAERALRALLGGSPPRQGNPPRAAEAR